MPFEDDTLNVAVLSDDFSGIGGTFLPLTGIVIDSGSAFYVANGKWDAGEVTLGRSYDMSMTMTRPFRTMPGGMRDTQSWMTVRRLVTTHKDTGAYSVKAVMPRRQSRSKMFMNSTALDSDNNLILTGSGTLNSWHNGNAEVLSLDLTSDDARPVNIVNLEHFCDYEPREAS